MASLRSIANCIGISGNFSVVRNFFGYASGVYGHISLATELNGTSANVVKIDPTAPGQLSLLGQIKLLQGPHVHFDVIRVGIEDITTTDEQEIDIAVQMTRELYARIGLGVGRVLRWFMTKAEADGYTVIDTPCEAFDLLDEWYAPGDGIDIFFVQDVNFGLAGATPSKDASGSIIELTGTVTTGIAVAHEVGHYLGLGHTSTKTNLMLGTGFPSPPYTITSSQASKMKDHDAVHGGC